jgi:hypothetical protein
MNTPVFFIKIKRIKKTARCTAQLANVALNPATVDGA